jgi:predicted nucleotide-binding protein
MQTALRLITIPRANGGMADIAATILNKIADAAVFVADLTPIAQSSDGKWLPNPNVMIELGWAMHRPGWERVIGILNMASGAKVEDLPFDIRQRRVVTFVLAENADRKSRAAERSKLVNELKEALQINLEERADDIAAASTISGVAATP